MAGVTMAETHASAEPDLSGAVLGRYRLLRRLGQGGMGSVYLAEHELIDRRAAIKVLHPDLAAEPRSRKRFLREARAASTVHHPGVVEILDVGFSGNHVYFVMELLEGQDLAQRLQASRCMSWPEAAPILVDVAEALDAAHRAGVVHRDVKPANCFLVASAPGQAPRVKVVDFGIAKVAAGDRTVVEELTTTGEVFGTVAYMPPEIGQGITNDPRSDVYALGVMMFRMLTGQLPFVGTALEVITQHIGKAPPAPRSLEPSIPPSVERIIVQALEKQPEDRQPSMRHLVAQLR
ncbi:MAG: serine/threonine protein kinase, partial [Myxococcales bacterium]|nr:serine/threonine protein kinase [Myxococcales bacterium]